MELNLLEVISEFFISMFAEKVVERIKGKITGERDRKKIAQQLEESLCARLGLKNNDILSNKGLINYVKFDLSQDASHLFSLADENDEEKNKIIHKACGRAGIDQNDLENRKLVSSIISFCLDSVEQYYIDQASDTDRALTDLAAQKAAKETVRQLFIASEKEKAKLSSEIDTKIKEAWLREVNDCPSMKTLPDKSKYEINSLVRIEGSTHEGLKDISLKEAIEQTWNIIQTESKISHISLYGVGGLGKTISLLKLKFADFERVIYIPLRSLARRGSIKEYLTETVFRSRDDLYTEFIRLCDLYREGKPQFLLILDGINEIDKRDRKDVLLDEIEFYSRFKSLQLIISSRYDILPECRALSDKVLRFRMCPLSTVQIESFLQNASIQVPDPENRIWKVIDTPLMLSLYSSAELFRNEYREDKDVLFFDTTNAGSIIWNYLQTEMYRYKSKNRNAVAEAVIALEYIAPYLAFRMQQGGNFIWTCRTFKDNVQIALASFNDDKESNKLPDHVALILDNSLESTDNINRDQICQVLLNDLCIFVNTHNTIQFMHQHFRDALAALFLFQKAQTAKTEIPELWKKMKDDQYVFGFLSDYFQTDVSHDIWNRLWTLMREETINNKNGIPDSSLIRTLLNLYKQAYGNEFEDVSFAGLNISTVPLLKCHPGKKQADLFDKTIIGPKTLYGDGHSMKICSVSWSIDGKQYLSASNDTTLRIWDNKEQNVIINKVNPHSHYIRYAQWNPVNQSMIASAGDDKEVILWTKKGTEWEYEILGKTSDWIYSLCWDSTGETLACCDREGNVYSFSVFKKNVLYKKHPKEAKCVACSHNSLFASGDIGGTVYIHEFGVQASKLTLKFAKGISSVQWTGNDILAVFTPDGFWLIDCMDLIGRGITEWSQNDSDGLILNDATTGTIIAVVNSFSGTDYYAVFKESSLKVYKGLYDDNNIFHLAMLDTVEIDSKEFGVISCAAWNRDCSRILFGSRIGSIMEAELHQQEDTFDRILLRKKSDGNPNSARCSAWNTEGTLLAVGYDDAYIRIWNLKDQRCEKILKGHIDSVKCLCWEPVENAERLLSGSDDGSVVIWNLNTEKMEIVLGQKLSPVNCILWDKDQRIICGTDNNGLCLWNLQTGSTEFVVSPVETRIYSVVKLPEEDIFISAGNDAVLYLWKIDGETNNSILIQAIDSRHTEPIRGLTWTPDKDGVISASNDCDLYCHQFVVKNRQLSDKPTTLEHHHENYIYNVTISGNEKYIVSASTDTTVGIWDAYKHSFIKSLDEHEAFVWNVSPGNDKNGSYYIASSSSDGTTRIWDVTDIDPSKEMKSVLCLKVLSGVELVDCDFSKAIISDTNLKELIRLNGGIVS